MTEMSTILVTGATGTLGREVVSRLRAEGESVRALSRRAHAGEAGVTWVVADLVSGEELAAAVDGVDVIVHAASDPRHPRTDATGTAHLLAEASRAGVRH